MDTLSEINIKNASKITISGAIKVQSATPTQISVVIGEKCLNIFGEGLTVSKIDVSQKIVEAEGQIFEIKYSSPKEKTGVFKRIFK